MTVREGSPIVLRLWVLHRNRSALGVDQYAKRRKRSAREQRDHERLRQSKASFQASSLFEESVLDEVIVENT